MHIIIEAMITFLPNLNEFRLPKLHIAHHAKSYEYDFQGNFLTFYSEKREKQINQLLTNNNNLSIKVETNEVFTFEDQTQLQTIITKYLKSIFDNGFHLTKEEVCETSITMSVNKIRGFSISNYKKYNGGFNNLLKIDMPIEMDTKTIVCHYENTFHVKKIILDGNILEVFGSTKEEKARYIIDLPELLIKLIQDIFEIGWPDHVEVKVIR